MYCGYVVESLARCHQFVWVNRMKSCVKTNEFSAFILLALLIGLLCGCGNSDSSDGTEGSVQQRRSGSFSVTGPMPGGDRHSPPRIPSQYECNDSQIWLPLSLENVPSEAVELVMATLWSDVEKTGTEVNVRLYETWMVGGLEPQLRRLDVGELPNGAFVRSEHHSTNPCALYEIGEYRLSFRIYALPEKCFLIYLLIYSITHLLIHYSVTHSLFQNR